MNVGPTDVTHEGGWAAVPEMVTAYINAPDGTTVSLALAWADPQGPMVAIHIGERLFAFDAAQTRSAAGLCLAILHDEQAAHLVAPFRGALLKVFQALDYAAAEIEGEGVTRQ